MEEYLKRVILLVCLSVGPEKGQTIAPWTTFSVRHCRILSGSRQTHQWKQKPQAYMLTLDFNLLALLQKRDLLSVLWGKNCGLCCNKKHHNVCHTLSQQLRHWSRTKLMLLCTADFWVGVVSQGNWSSHSYGSWKRWEPYVSTWSFGSSRDTALRH
jgi:hypothetical protein